MQPHEEVELGIEAMFNNLKRKRLPSACYVVFCNPESGRKYVGKVIRTERSLGVEHIAQLYKRSSPKEYFAQPNLENLIKRTSPKNYSLQPGLKGLIIADEFMTGELLRRSNYTRKGSKYLVQAGSNIFTLLSAIAPMQKAKLTKKEFSAVHDSIMSLLHLMCNEQVYLPDRVFVCTEVPERNTIYGAFFKREQHHMVPEVPVGPYRNNAAFLASWLKTHVPDASMLCTESMLEQITSAYPTISAGCKNVVSLPSGQVDIFGPRTSNIRPDRKEAMVTLLDMVKNIGLQNHVPAQAYALGYVQKNRTYYGTTMKFEVQWKPGAIHPTLSVYASAPYGFPQCTPAEFVTNYARDVHKQDVRLPLICDQNTLDEMMRAHHFVDFGPGAGLLNTPDGVVEIFVIDKPRSSALQSGK